MKKMKRALMGLVMAAMLITSVTGLGALAEGETAGAALGDGLMVSETAEVSQHVGVSISQPEKVVAEDDETPVLIQVSNADPNGEAVKVRLALYDGEDDGMGHYTEMAVAKIANMIEKKDDMDPTVVGELKLAGEPEIVVTEHEDEINRYLSVEIPAGTTASMLLKFLMADGEKIAIVPVLVDEAAFSYTELSDAVIISGPEGSEAMDAETKAEEAEASEKAAETEAMTEAMTEAEEMADDDQTAGTYEPGYEPAPDGMTEEMTEAMDAETEMVETEMADDMTDDAMADDAMADDAMVPAEGELAMFMAAIPDADTDGGVTGLTQDVMCEPYAGDITPADKTMAMDAEGYASVSIQFSNQSGFPYTNVVLIDKAAGAMGVVNTKASTGATTHFEFSDNDSLEVVLVDADGMQTTLQQGVDYTVDYDMARVYTEGDWNGTTEWSSSPMGAEAFRLVMSEYIVLKDGESILVTFDVNFPEGTENEAVAYNTVGARYHVEDANATMEAVKSGITAVVPEEPETETEAPETETEAPETETETETAAPETETETETESQAPETESQAPETESQAPETETQAPETESQAPETKAPETESQAPETKAPETETQAPETKAPETETQAPETKAPETKAPETETQAPETKAPETKAPETQAPTTEPTTAAPTTAAPTTEAEPMTLAPTPTTAAPTTAAPTTAAPTTVAPTSGGNGADTGDHNPVGLLIGVAVVALIALIGGIVLLMKRR